MEVNVFVKLPGAAQILSREGLTAQKPERRFPATLFSFTSGSSQASRLRFLRTTAVAIPQRYSSGCVRKCTSAPQSV